MLRFMNFILLFNMMMWNPQDPYHTGALHAFQPNLDDIPIITRNNKQAKPIMASHIMPIMASNILNAPCLKMSNNQKHNDNRRKRSHSPRTQDTNRSRRSRSPSRQRPPKAPSPRASPPRDRVPPAEVPDYTHLLEQLLMSTKRPQEMTPYSQKDEPRYESRERHYDSRPEQRNDFRRNEPHHDEYAPRRNDQHHENLRRESPRPDDRFTPRQDFARTGFGGGTVLLSTTLIAPGITIKAWWNPETNLKGAYRTYTATIEEKSFVMMEGFQDNWMNYMKKVTKHFPVVPNPILHFPQINDQGNNVQARSEITEYMAANSAKVASLTSQKTALNPSPTKKGKPSKVLNVDAEVFMTSESMLKEQRLKTAAAFLNMYGLEDINTTHSVFKALALFYDVDVGPSTSTLSTRTQALDKLAAAMAEGIENGISAPTYTDIRTQADEIDKMEMTQTSNAKSNKKTPNKIPKKHLNDNAIIEIEDNDLNPNELKQGKNAKK